ncbi:porphobilinogen synthase [Gammaproteobacteria bacterium]|nr:porphobilinogen synthase [Gammaproteobacteria bacterium]
MRFPNTRMRRSRSQAWSRTLVREVVLTPQDLIWPVFIHNESCSSPILAMENVDRLGVEQVIEQAGQLHQKGLQAIAVFPVVGIEHKDDMGSYALNDSNFLYSAITQIKKAIPTLGVIADVALDPYTTHGHDGILAEDGTVDNDRTCQILAMQAVKLLKAGADVVAPSDMQDGRIHVIRERLESLSMHYGLILSYSAKYSSAFYGPFRHAVGSAGSLAGKSKDHYQMDFHNIKEALVETQLDLDEGADWVMVKPAMAYMDVICRLSGAIQAPIMAYQVSGEYQMLMKLADGNKDQAKTLFYESLIGIKRAGASGIFTYAAPLMLDFLAD